MAYDANGTPVRRGKNKQMCLDEDAVHALNILAPGPRAQGRVVSELLRAELVRREERARLREVVLKALAQTPCDVPVATLAEAVNVIDYGPDDERPGLTGRKPGHPGTTWTVLSARR